MGYNVGCSSHIGNAKQIWRCGRSRQMVERSAYMSEKGTDLQIHTCYYHKRPLFLQKTCQESKNACHVLRIRRTLQLCSFVPRSPDMAFSCLPHFAECPFHKLILFDFLVVSLLIICFTSFVPSSRIILLCPGG